MEKIGVESQNQTNQNWWQMSRQALCLACRTENVVADAVTKFACKKCGVKQYVARQFLDKDILKHLLKKNQANCEYCCFKKLFKIGGLVFVLR